MKTILIEKNPDLQFDSDSTATIKINSLVLPDLKLDGVAILRYPIYLKALSGSLNNVDIHCRMTQEMMQKGVITLGAYLDGDYLVVGVCGKAIFKENEEICRISFIERVAIYALEGKAPPTKEMPFEPIQKKAKASKKAGKSVGK